MKSELSVIQSPVFGRLLQGELFGREVRVRTDERGAPWFVAKDVCDILGLDNVAWALKGLDQDEKGVSISETLGGPQKLSEVSESGLYHLIFKSRKPEAAAFRKWVTREVLPAIRREGFYAQGEEGLANAAMRGSDYMAVRGIEGSTAGFGHSAVAACLKLGVAFHPHARRGHRYPVAALDWAARRRKAARGPLCREPSAARVFLFRGDEAKSAPRHGEVSHG